uniref:Stress-response A/B barrel domain-containing protein n=1 Tax=Streptomyces sp. NBC_01401 TaxID=2903854 RepID=A0AAU3GQ09_9ACTN
MIHHTMIVSFNDSLPDAELDQFLKGMEQLMRDSGTIRTCSARRHIRVPVDDHSPVFAATAVVQFGFADLDALNASFVAPGVEEFIRDWKSRFPYQVVWVNHEPLD